MQEASPAVPILWNGKTQIEYRRILLTRIFVVFAIAVMALTSSRWSASGFASGTYFVVGIILATVGSLGRIWCSLYIGGRKTQSLIVSGPYSICRNPLYLFSSLGAVGVALGTSTITIPCLLLVFFAAYYPRIIRDEESRLRGLHGDEFGSYCRNVPRFFPRTLTVSAPETYEISTRLVHRAILDASCFVWLTLGVHFLYQLHQRTDFLPSLVSLY